MSDGRKLVSVPPRRERESLTPEERERRRAEGLAKLGRMIGRMQDQNFFGKITVTLQDGNIVELRTEQVIKPDDF